MAALLLLVSDAAAIEVVVDGSTGEVYLKNDLAASETIDGYSLFAPGASLLPAAWTPIADFYDADGDQSVDPTTEWFVISQTSLSIAEASSVALSAALDPGQVVSLGEIWSVGDAEALAVTLSAGATTTEIIGDFRDLTADYDGDLDVDNDDYDVYVTTLGSTSDLAADGNNNGIIDAADYVVWRESPELQPETSTLAGDYDNDFDVDLADYALLSATYGSSTVLAADGNSDGVVDAPDYTVWRDAYELTIDAEMLGAIPSEPTVANGAVGASPIPEPAASVIAVLSLANAAWRRPRR